MKSLRFGFSDMEIIQKLGRDRGGVSRQWLEAFEPKERKHNENLLAALDARNTLIVSGDSGGDANR